MTVQPVARRYAQALFDVTQAVGAQASGQTDGIIQTLGDLAKLTTSNEELHKLIGSPTIPPAVKKAVMLGIVDQAGVTLDPVRRLVGMLGDQDRLSILGQVAEAFAERVRESRKVAYADVVTAVPLTPASRAALEDALGRASGKTVTLLERVDPSIIGGVVATIGSFVYDGSVAHQLDKIKTQLTANN
jgi:F-type H+-transporting ATPase subunit delta